MRVDPGDDVSCRDFLADLDDPVESHRRIHRILGTVAAGPEGVGGASHRLRIDAGDDSRIRRTDLAHRRRGMDRCEIIERSRIATLCFDQITEFCEGRAIIEPA